MKPSIIALWLGLAAAAHGAVSAEAEEPDDSLATYIVHVDRTPKQPWIGYGVYLGRGIVITAAHVAGLGFWRRPRVEIDGTDLPTSVVKDGHFHGVDLTLLSVDERQIPVSLALHRMPLCTEPSRAGEAVVLFTPDGMVRSRVLSPRQLPPGIGPQFNTVVGYVDGSTNSGAGVFDANKKCLLGIITRKITKDEVVEEDGAVVNKQLPFAIYFLPAATIANFIPNGIRF